MSLDELPATGTSQRGPSDIAPDRFVKSQTAAARRKVAAWDAYDAGTGPKPSGERPTERERWLAECQSGHLEQNAVHQNVRGDVCSNPPSCRQTYVSPGDRAGAGATAAPGGGFYTNRVGSGCNGTPGYSEDGAACMPQQGSATNRGDGHHFATQSERRDSHAQGQPGGTYPRDAATSDADARTTSLLRDHGNGRPNQPQGTTAATGGTAAGAAGAATGEAGDAAAVGDGAATNPAQASPAVGSVAEFAAECINQRRREINQQMVQQCMDREARNRAAAGSDSARQAALTAREDAERRLAETTEGTPEHEQARRDYRRASARHTRMQRSACLAEQGAWLNDPNNQAGPCVVPNNPRPDDASGSEGGDVW